MSRRRRWDSTQSLHGLLPAVPSARNLYRTKQKRFSSSVRSGIFGSGPIRTHKFILMLCSPSKFAWSFQGLDISDQGGNLLRLKFAGEGGHLARLALADPVGNPVVAKVQLVKIRTLVAAGVGAMAMGAIV